MRPSFVICRRVRWNRTESLSAATSDEDTRPLVSSGQAALETEVRIVHAETRVSLRA
jgi:hypothetical protein